MIFGSVRHLGWTWLFEMEKKSEVAEQNFTKGKALHYLCSVMQCEKFGFMIKKFET